MLNEFVKKTNKKLDYFVSQKIELTWYHQGNDLYVCDLKHYSTKVDDIKNVQEIVMFVVGLGLGLGEDLIDIWINILRFQDIVDGNL